VTSAGLSAPFFTGCHSAATGGYRLASEFALDTLWPEQNGHPCRTRRSNASSQTWSAPPGHFHQTARVEVATTSSGRRRRFLVGCHCSANAGKRVRSEFVTDARRFEQNGHEPRTRVATVADHSWSGPFGHFHHATRCELGATFGPSTPFLAASQESATPGWRAMSPFLPALFDQRLIHRSPGLYSTCLAQL
jgi:hypothetical protein